MSRAPGYAGRYVFLDARRLAREWRAAESGVAAPRWRAASGSTPIAAAAPVRRAADHLALVAEEIAAAADEETPCPTNDSAMFACASASTRAARAVDPAGDPRLTPSRSAPRSRSRQPRWNAKTVRAENPRAGIPFRLPDRAGRTAPRCRARGDLRRSRRLVDAVGSDVRGLHLARRASGSAGSSCRCRGRPRRTGCSLMPTRTRAALRAATARATTCRSPIRIRHSGTTG
jgi:hypothetical protein